MEKQDLVRGHTQFSIRHEYVSQSVCYEALPDIPLVVSANRKWNPAPESLNQ